MGIDAHQLGYPRITMSYWDMSSTWFASSAAEDLDLVSGSESAFFDILDLNLGSVYRISKLVVPHMLRAGGGSIVNISSIGGMIPRYDVGRHGGKRRRMGNRDRDPFVFSPVRSGKDQEGLPV